MCHINELIYNESKLSCTQAYFTVLYVYYLGHIDGMSQI